MQGGGDGKTREPGGQKGVPQSHPGVFAKATAPGHFLDLGHLREVAFG